MYIEARFILTDMTAVVSTVSDVGVTANGLSLTTNHEIRSQVKRDYPLNLSILIRGGKENNHDTLSNGE
jgi:hypothetical protein